MNGTKSRAQDEFKYNMFLEDLQELLGKYEVDVFMYAGFMNAGDKMAHMGGSLFRIIMELDAHSRLREIEAGLKKSTEQWYESLAPIVEGKPGE